LSYRAAINDRIRHKNFLQMNLATGKLKKYIYNGKKLETYSVGLSED